MIDFIAALATVFGGILGGYRLVRPYIRRALYRINTERELRKCLWIILPDFVVGAPIMIPTADPFIRESLWLDPNKPYGCLFKPIAVNGKNHMWDVAQKHRERLLEVAEHPVSNPEGGVLHLIPDYRI